MNQEFKAKILKYLFEKQQEVNVYELTAIATGYEKYEMIPHEKQVEMKPKIHHFMIILKDQGFVEQRIDERDPINPVYFYRISVEGMKEFDTKPVKAWRFLNGPFHQGLTLLNTILAIAAIIVGWIAINKP